MLEQRVKLKTETNKGAKNEHIFGSSFLISRNNLKLLTSFYVA